MGSLSRIYTFVQKNTEGDVNVTIPQPVRTFKRKTANLAKKRLHEVITHTGFPVRKLEVTGDVIGHALATMIVLSVPYRSQYFEMY